MSDPSERPPLEETHPHLTEFLAFLSEVSKESDRGVVLICCSFVDELLRRTLAAFFIENEGRRAMLAALIQHSSGRPRVWRAGAMST
jgi:hypothetical protein